MNSDGLFSASPIDIAKRLIGASLSRALDGGSLLSGVIVETEAYVGAQDRAAHCFGGRRTARNESMYARAGTAYVYFTYGMHHCMNVVCGEVGEPVAVLIRALEPVEGIDAMRANRLASPKAPARLRDVDLCSGPGKLCQAMGIDRAHDGVDLLSGGALRLELGDPVPENELTRTARVGVGGAGEWAEAPLRWFWSGNPHVSGGKPSVRRG